MAVQSALNVLIDALLPATLQNSDRIYDKKGVDELMTQVAKERPELYPVLAKQLGDIGRKQAYRRGETFLLEDFAPTFDRDPLYAELDAKEALLRKSVSDPDELRSALGDLYSEYSERIAKETNRAALGKRNNIALSVLTGARGKEGQLRDMISTPGFYSDARGGVVPWFVRRSFSEGVRPADFLAGTYSAREAVVGSKRATAKGGFMAKTLSRAAATHVVSQNDCGTTNGIDLPLTEPDLRGRVLQRAVGDFPAGTVLDRKTLASLKNKGTEEVIVRSPLTCGAEHGLCSKCFGVKAEGRFPKIGEHVGITAATSLGEPLTQAALSLKHLTSGKGKAKEFSGLDYLQQFMDSPEEYKDRAIVTTTNGVVDRVQPAPQGGNYVIVSGKEHYVPLSREITVEPGQALEAGDQITDGLLDVEDVVNYKGLGAARRYWADRVSEMAKASNAGMDRRLFEVLARANVDHVDLDDPLEDGYLPDDRTRYSSYVHRRQPAADAMEVPAHAAVGKWLEQPVLHHTIGTKVTPKIADTLAAKGFGKLFVSEQAPAFRPAFVRVQQVASTDDDWLASLGGSYLGSQLQQGIMRAQDTNIEENVHPVPRLAVGVGYAKDIETTGKF